LGKFIPNGTAPFTFAFTLLHIGLFCSSAFTNFEFQYDKWQITDLYLPSQTVTSDSCEIDAEGCVEILNFAKEFGLVQLGWIHVSFIYIHRRTCGIEKRIVASASPLSGM
jgi:hypothetical protein